MARIQPKQYDEVDAPTRAIWDQQVADHGRMTNMKRTLAHSQEALRALMEWYPLYGAVKEFLDEYSTLLFTSAISAQTDCLVCSTFFRRILLESGKNPDEFEPDARQQLLIDYGRQLAKNAHDVDSKLYSRLQEAFTDEQIVVLTAFGGLMIATNIFNNALRVDLDEYLQPYRKKEER